MGSQKREPTQAIKKGGISLAGQRVNLQTRGTVMEGGQQREAKEEVRKAMDPSGCLQLSQVLQDIHNPPGVMQYVIK